MKIEHTHIPGSSQDAIILLHGYGADMNDLAPLHRYLDPEGKWHWYFPNGPVRVPFGGMWEGRAWFPIDMEELDRAMRENRPRAFADKKPAEFTSSLELMKLEVSELQKKHKKVVIGGFSQGAMMATHLAAQLTPQALVILSGTLLDKEGLLSAKSTAAVPFFQSHGDQDPLLSLSQAKDLNALLKEKGWDGIWAPFRGGHEIPEKVLMTLSSFLHQVI
ncbi:MAG: dienelactone hydrolase family protein [Bacteriovoracaceae bacterium]|nr:dienelactone hydrolase family protein [Bacteriovoracaceae bacterium]